MLALLAAEELVGMLATVRVYPKRGPHDFGGANITTNAKTHE